jgi:aldehyde:ferredoxin oxidoreductase
MDTMYYGDTLIVDLEAGGTEQVRFTEADEAGPGLAAGLALYERHKDSDPLVFGSGLLAATPVPGACLGFVLGRSPLNGEPAVAPLSMYAGAEMKLSGFSAAVVKGASAKPVYLWLHDGVADIQNASALWGADTWKTTDSIRREMGESLIQVISIGPAGEEQSDLASFSINYWGSGDSAAHGKTMGAKNLKGVAVRGLGMLDAEEPEEFYNRALKITKAAPADKGFKGICSRLAADDIDDWLRPLVHRYRSCFACPCACSTFVKYNEAPSVLESSEVEEPGMMVTSASAALWLKQGGWEAEAACRAMESMARAGIDLVRGARELSTKPVSEPALIAASVKDLKGSEDAAWPPGETPPFSELFGGWVPPVAPEDEWLAANRLGYVLGVCPTYLLSSGIDSGALLEICVPAAGLEIDAAAVAGMF